MTSFRRIGLALVAGFALMMPVAASAATQSAPMTLPLTGGALSITAASALNFPSTAVTALTLATPLHSAQYTDATATGAGWNATLAVQQFHIVPTWVTGSGSSLLVAQTSGQYTGPATNGSYTVTMTQFSQTGGTSGGPAGSYSWTGAETGATSGLVNFSGGASPVGTLGVTILFDSTHTYKVGDTYSIMVGNLATTALALNQPTTSITTVSGGTAPVATGGTATVTGTSPSTYGTAVKFATAAVATGNGTYTIVPGATLTWTSATWAASYVSSAQYTITAGP